MFAKLAGFLLAIAGAVAILFGQQPGDGKWFILFGVVLLVIDDATARVIAAVDAKYPR